MNQIELIHWGLITESPLNPRKSFSKESIQELSESIAKQGLLQPITVRPFPDRKVNAPEELQGKLCYEIICGARRYRASMMVADLIPCIVREMTDEEAFDAMITENLQRKDVAPMDEARAFFELHKREVSFEELAARFGKSVQFIRLRIKLNDLVPGLVDLLEKKELQLSHAQELCKLDPERQESLLKERYSDDSASYYSYRFKPLNQIIDNISSDFKNLDNAKFDKTDCATCEFRCGFNALFSEYDENKCTKPECFKDLTTNARCEKSLEKEKEGCYLVKRSNVNDGSNEVIESLENSGSSFLDWNNVNTVSIQEMPDPGDYENGVEDEQYIEDCKEVKPIIEEQNKQFESGELKRVWLVGVFNEDCERVIKVSKAGALNENAEQEKQLKELQGKDKRNSEIKGEKIIEDLRTMMSGSKYGTLDHELADTERFSMYAFMLMECYTSKTDIEAGFEKDINYLSNIMKLDIKVLNKIIRGYLKQKSTSGDVSYNKNVQTILSAVCGLVYPDEVTRIELKHEDTYLKRKERIDEQIKSLS